METPKATEGITSLATPSQAPSPSPIPSEEPSPTATPTENPLAGAPDGATGKDANGNWTKTEIGVMYTWTTITDSLGVERFRGWFSNHVTGGNLLDGGIPLQDFPMDGGYQSVPLYIFGESGALPDYFQHPVQDTNPQRNFSGPLFNQLLNRNSESLSRQAMADALANGTAVIHFKTADGKDYYWKPSKDRGVKFYAVAWDEADPSIHPEYYETLGDAQFEKDANMRWTVFVDSDGSLVIVSAVQNPGNFTEVEKMERILNPMGEMLSHEQLPAKVAGWMAIDGTYPTQNVQNALRAAPVAQFIISQIH